MLTFSFPASTRWPNQKHLVLYVVEPTVRSLFECLYRAGFLTWGSAQHGCPSHYFHVLALSSNVRKSHGKRKTMFRAEVASAIHAYTFCKCANQKWVLIVLVFIYLSGSVHSFCLLYLVHLLCRPLGQGGGNHTNSLPWHLRWNQRYNLRTLGCTKLMDNIMAVKSCLVILLHYFYGIVGI